MVEAIIVHDGGSEKVENFDKITEHIEETPTIRVWKDDDYTDYKAGTIVEVNP